MSTSPTEVENTELSIEEWGDDKVVSHFGGEGEWIMYQPDEDVVDVTDWR